MEGCPAKFYVRYRISQMPKASSKDIIKALLKEEVYVPNDKYVDEQREIMALPGNFDPEHIGDQTISLPLHKAGIWSLYSPNRGTKEALRVFHRSSYRMILETLIQLMHNPLAVIETYREKTHDVISESGVAEYCHYWWNEDSASWKDFDEYIAGYRKDPNLIRAHRMVPSVGSTRHVLSKMGLDLHNFNVTEALKDMRASAYGMALEYRDLQSPGRIQYEGFASCCKTFGEVEKQIRDYAEEGEDIHDKARIFIAKTHDAPIIDLEAVGRGAVPYPVALLGTPEELEPEEGEGGGGK